MEKCIEGVQSWLSANFVKMNKDKTEIPVMFIKSKRSTCSKMSSVFNICNEEVEASTAVSNQGATFDCHMSMDCHVSKIGQSANFHLRNVDLLKRYLTQYLHHSLVQSLVISRLDYANCLLAGAAASQLLRLPKYKIMLLA